MPDNKTYLHLRIGEAQKLRFYRKCKRSGDVPAAVVRRLIDGYAGGAIAFPVSQQKGK